MTRSASARLRSPWAAAMRLAAPMSRRDAAYRSASAAGVAAVGSPETVGAGAGTCAGLAAPDTGTATEAATRAASRARRSRPLRVRVMADGVPSVPDVCRAYGTEATDHAVWPASRRGVNPPCSSEVLRVGVERRPVATNARCQKAGSSPVGRQAWTRGEAGGHGPGRRTLLAGIAQPDRDGRDLPFTAVMTAAPPFSPPQVTSEFVRAPARPSLGDGPRVTLTPQTARDGQSAVRSQQSR